MNEIELKKLYDKLSPKFELGNFESFKNRMRTPEMRKSFFDVVNKKVDIGKYEDFESRLKGGSPASTTQAKFIPCVQKKGTPRPTKSSGMVIQYNLTVWDKPLVAVYQTINGKTSRFKVLSGKYKEKMGVVSCTQTGKAYYILDEDKAQKSQEGGNGGETIVKPKRTWNNVTFTLDDILSGKSSIKWGDKGPVVKEVQTIMGEINLGSVSKSGKPDGYFGKRTTLAVKQFQGNNMSKGSMTGVVDSKTLKRMIELRDYDGSTPKEKTANDYSPQGVPDDALNPQMPIDGQNVEPTTSNAPKQKLSITQDAE